MVRGQESLQEGYPRAVLCKGKHAPFAVLWGFPRRGVRGGELVAKSGKCCENGPTHPPLCLFQSKLEISAGVMVGHADMGAISWCSGDITVSLGPGM